MLLLVLLIPVFFQIIVGGKSKSKSIDFSFEYVCIISYLLQVVVGFGMILYMTTWNLHCGQPFAGLIMLSVLMMFVITIVIIMQIFRYRY